MLSVTVPASAAHNPEFRFYDPLVARFIQPDTIVPDPGDPQSLNRYSYVGNGPVTFRDPTGHRACIDIDCSRTEVVSTILALPTRRSAGPSPVPVPAPGPAPLPGEVVGSDIADPSRWCGTATCPNQVDPGYQFGSDSEAIAFLRFVTSGLGGDAYGFVDDALGSGELWASYTTSTGRQMVRFAPGVGWVRRTTGLQAGQVAKASSVLKVGGRTLIVIGGALEGLDEWGASTESSTGVRVFRSVVAGGTDALATWGGATGGASIASRVCAATTCGGPWLTAAAIGAGGLIGALGADQAQDVIVQELLGS